MKTINQFSKFAVVGVINTIINLLILFILTEVFFIYYIISAVLAFIVAVSNSFILNKIWTFNEKIKDDPFNKCLKFFVVSVSALVVNLVILFILTEVFFIYYMISQVVAIAISLWINFLGNKAWTFRS